MSVFTAAGAKLFIGTTLEADSLVEFQGDSYIEVGEIEDLGEFGDESEEVNFTALSDGRVRKIKGPRNAGTMAVVCGDDDSDLGQQAMDTAEESVLDFNFRVVLNDAKTLGGTPSEYFFRAKVFSKRKAPGQANNVVRVTFNLGINSSIIPVAST